MKTTVSFSQKIHTNNYIVLASQSPFVEIILRNTGVTESEFPRILQLIHQYPNDPRLTEMVRVAGDTSAKVPYLLDEGETAASILNTLRNVAHPHAEKLRNLPEQVRSTIYTLLAINQLPVGYEVYGIPALLELDGIQQEIILALRKLMTGRKLAEEFLAANLAALREIDSEWPRLEKRRITYWPNNISIPQQAQTQYQPVFENNQLLRLYETSVIVTPPWAKEFQQYIPQVLRRPMGEQDLTPATGSVDWLLREGGKVGKHVTRALLELIRTHLEEERLAMDMLNYERINQASHEILKEYIGKTP